ALPGERAVGARRVRRRHERDGCRQLSRLYRLATRRCRRSERVRTAMSGGVRRRVTMGKPRLAAVALLILAVPTIARAGTGTWTSHGPTGGNVTVVAVDPLTPTTVYAGTHGGGIFKSTDGGATW